MKEYLMNRLDELNALETEARNLFLETAERSQQEEAVLAFWSKIHEARNALIRVHDLYWPKEEEGA